MSVVLNLEKILKDIKNYNPRIIAVTKYYGTEKMIEAYNAGLRDGNLVLAILGGTIMGAAVSGAFALGGAAATTGLTIFGKAVSGVTMFAVAAYGTALAGIVDYQLTSMAYGRETSLEGYLLSGFNGFMEGIVSFMAGGLAGIGGYYKYTEQSIFKYRKIIEMVERVVLFSIPSSIIRSINKKTSQYFWGIRW